MYEQFLEVHIFFQYLKNKKESELNTNSFFRISLERVILLLYKNQFFIVYSMILYNYANIEDGYAELDGCVLILAFIFGLLTLCFVIIDEHYL